MTNKKNMHNIFYKFIYEIYNNTWIKSIRYGLLKVQPIILLNCIMIFIINIDSEIYNSFMTQLIDSNWKDTFNHIHTYLYKIVKILTIVSISTELGRIRKNRELAQYINNNINTNIVGFIGLISAYTFNNILDIDSFLAIKNSFILDANWQLIAIITGLIFSEIYIKIYYNLLRRKKNLAKSYDKVVSQSFLAITPTIMTLVIACILAFLIKDAFLYILDKVFSTTIYGSNNFTNDIKYMLLNNILWVIGGHGGDLIIHNDSFSRLPIDTFSSIGGAGSTLCLIIGLIIYSKNYYNKKTATISIIPSIFNINETVMFGLPVLFNPIYIIPFVLVPIVSYIISYIATQIGFIEVVNTNISWIAPIFLNSYKLTGGYSGVALQLINIIIGVAIYLPFIKMSDVIDNKEREVSYNKFKDEVFSGKLEKLNLGTRGDSIGTIGVFLGEELKNMLEEDSKNQNQLYIQYQPQLNKKRKVIGVEALLRWNHKEFGYIPPNIIIVVAEELGLICDLGKWISKEAISQLSKWNNELDNPIDMSINASTKQLIDEDFANHIIDTINLYNVNPNNIKIELTENFAIGEDTISKNQLKKLASSGVKLVIDDFGIGYNPILYIKKYKIDSIKIDGSLIRDIDVNEESQSIVSAMYSLCESTNIKIINEFVETEKQKQILDNMGDGLYQGYLFSKPLCVDECLQYIKNNI